MFPTSVLGKKKLLYVINKIIYSNKPLDRRLKSGEMFFPRKSVTQKSHKLRPITQMNKFAALCDRLVSARLDKLIQADQALAKSRYGFLQRKNIDMLMGEMQEHLYRAKSDGQKTAIIFGDQTGAYDAMPHKKLIVKLFKLLKRLSPELRRFGSVTLGYIARWLSNRRVKFGVQTVYLKIGLPQGSPLSPCVYVLFFDIENSDGRQFIFADDLIIIITGGTWQTVENMIQSALRYTIDWCSNNNANLNLSKTKVMCLKRKNQPPKIAQCDTVETHKTLGITFDTNQNYSLHVHNLTNSLNRKAAIIKMLRNKLNFSLKGLLSIYKTFRSSLLFGTYWIWSISNHQKNKLQSALAKLTKATFGFNKTVNNDKVFQIANLPDYQSYAGT